MNGFFADCLFFSDFCIFGGCPQYDLGAFIFFAAQMYLIIKKLPGPAGSGSLLSCLLVP